MVPSKPRRSAPKTAPGKASPRRRPKPVVEVPAQRDARSRRMSWQAGVFLAVLAIVLVTFLPSINSALKQAQQIAALNNEIDATRSEVEALREKNEDLKDPTHIARKAREEQYYVEKGKNAVIVTNQDAPEDDDSDTVSPQRSQPWYLELLESIEEVGNSSNTTGTSQ